MPNLRIDIAESRRADIPAIGEALHRSLVDALGMSPDDRFQVFTVHDEGELRFSRTYPDAARDEIIFVQVIANFGYSEEAKRAMFGAMSANISDLGIRPDTLLVVVQEVDPANWYAPSASVSSSGA